MIRSNNQSSNHHGNHDGLFNPALTGQTMTENETAVLLKSPEWISLDEQLPPLNNIFKTDCPIPFASKGIDKDGAFIFSHEEFLPGDEDILKDLGVTHWMPCDILEALVNTTTA